jgi:hypothetical protein
LIRIAMAFAVSKVTHYTNCSEVHPQIFQPCESVVAAALRLTPNRYT